MKVKSEELPQSPKTSMIDIIFQLLIFFMVSLALGTMETQTADAVKGEEQKDIPALPPMEKISSPQELTTGFLLHVDKVKEKPFNGTLGVYILDPSAPTLEDAQKDSLKRHGPYDLKRGSAELQKRIEDVIYQTGVRPRLEIRADKETPFGYILEVMEFCDQDSIAVVGFRFANVKNKIN